MKKRFDIGQDYTARIVWRNSEIGKLEKVTGACLFLQINIILIVIEKGKPVARRGRKVMDLPG